MGLSGIDIAVQGGPFEALPYWQAMGSVGVPPHVSILYPWRESPLSSADLAEAREVIGSTKAFSIEFDAVARFENGTVYAHIRENPAMVTLMRTVWAAFPETPPYGGEIAAPVPHLTLAKPAIADADEVEVVAELQTQLATSLPLRFDVDVVSILEQGSDDTWSTAALLRLRGE